MVIPAWAVGATVEAPCYRPTVMISTYLEDGVGLSVGNRSVLANIGQRLRRLGHGADEGGGKHEGPIPFVVGGDFNLTPEALAGASFPRMLDATVVAPRSARGTRRTAKSQRTLDVRGIQRDGARHLASLHG